MKPGSVVENARCEECGGKIRIAVVRKSGMIICERCLHPKTPSCSSGSTGQYHCEDDMSGASSSWDMVVRGQEGE